MNHNKLKALKQLHHSVTDYFLSFMRTIQGKSGLSVIFTSSGSLMSELWNETQLKTDHYIETYQLD